MIWRSIMSDIPVMEFLEKMQLTWGLYAIIALKMLKKIVKRAQAFGHPEYNPDSLIFRLENFVNYHCFKAFCDIAPNFMIKIFTLTCIEIIFVTEASLEDGDFTWWAGLKYDNRQMTCRFIMLVRQLSDVSTSRMMTAFGLPCPLYQTSPSSFAVLRLENCRGPYCSIKREDSWIVCVAGRECFSSKQSNAWNSSTKSARIGFHCC
jgi:hypothetical protein